MRGHLLVCALALAPLLAHGQAKRPRVPFSSPAARNAPSAPTRPAPIPRSDTVPLPFNLNWGDSQNRLAALFAGVGATITEKKPGPNGSQTWTVQGLIAPGLQASMFTFEQETLVALEFDYGLADWTEAKYNDIMRQLRQRLEAICAGPGEMVSRSTDQPADTSIKQSLMGYKWSKGDTLVELFYFSAEDPAKALKYRTISVHYQYQDPFAGQPAPPAGGNGNGSLFPNAAGPATAPQEPAVNVPSEAKPTPADPNALPER